MGALGIDIGSTVTKAVRIEKGEIAAFFRRPTSGDMLAAAVEAHAAVALAGSPVAVTGYGRKRAEAMGAVYTEITCHSRGVSRLFPGIEGFIDIGGQDAKAIRLEYGLPIDFALNDRCAAGTGRFLEVMALRLGFTPEEMGRIELPWKDCPELSSTCTVFSESEAVGLLAEGFSRETVAAAIFTAAARRISALAAAARLGGEIALTGGGALYGNLIVALQNCLETTTVVPPHPDLMGAYGAALLAEKSSEVAAR